MTESPLIHSFSHVAMGVTFWVRVAEEDFAFAQRAAEAAFFYLDELSREMGWADGRCSAGQMALVNRLPSGEVMAVSQGFADLWLAAEAYRIESKGAFDVRAGGLFNYWTQRSPASFSPDDTAWLAAVDGFKASSYRLEGLEFHALQAGATIDFRAIIRGYAVDRMTEILESTWGVHRALVIAGSAVVRALDPPGEGAGWRLAVGTQAELLLCRSALSSRVKSAQGSTLLDARIGEVGREEGVVRALAATAQDAQYLSLLGVVLDEAEAQRLLGENGQRGLWLMNDSRLGVLRTLPRFV
jgi:hypothetical protein